jgi:signal transduction histidine kinase
LLDPDKLRVQFGSTLVRMTVFILVPLTVLLVAVVVISQSIHHTAMQKLVGVRNLRAVQAASASIESELSRTSEQLIQIDTEPLKGTTNPDGVYNSEFPLGIYSFSCSATEVKVISSPLNSVDINTQDIPIAELCQSGTENQSLRVRYVLTEIQSKQVLWLAVGMESNSIVIAGLYLNQMLDRLLAIPLGQDNLAILVYDSDHTLRYETGERPAGDHTLYHTSILNGLQGTSGVMLPGGGHSSHIVTYTPVTGVNWIIVMDEAWEDISNPSLDTTQWIPLILIPVVILFSIIFFLGYRLIVKPLNLLQQKTSRLGQGDAHALEQQVGGVEEIRSLQAVLQKMSADLIQSRENLAGYASDLTQAIEAERKELARELHDDSLQDLIAIKQLVTAEETVRPKDMNEKIKAIIQKLRGVIRGLRPPYLDDLGLATALQVLAEEKSSLGVLITVETDGDESRYSPSVELVVYRIAQEAITNALKHANPKHIQVKIHYSGRNIDVSIDDDGKGFMVPDRLDQLAAKHCYGLLGMQERAEGVGCKLSVTSQPGKGTRVTVEYTQKDIDE